MDATPRLGLPYLSPGQAQKEMVHNQSLAALDAVVAGAVEEPPRQAPPASPAVGTCYLVAANATGAWAGKDKCIAAFTDAGWQFVQPVEGMSVYVRSSSSWALYRASNWEIGILRGSSVTLEGKQVVAGRRPAIGSVAGGAMVDSEARAAIESILSALRAHGLIET